MKVGQQKQIKAFVSPNRSYHLIGAQDWLTDRVFTLKVERNHAYATLFGYVKDENTNAPIEGAIISVQKIKVNTDKNGYFILNIPPERQRKQQRIRASKVGYKDYNRLNEPVIEDHETVIYLTRLE